MTMCEKDFVVMESVFMLFCVFMKFFMILNTKERNRGLIIKIFVL